jgi:preprotein translocase subunit SecY
MVFNIFKRAFTIPVLRSKIFVTLALLFLISFINNIPIPTINPSIIESFIDTQEANIEESPLLGVLSLVAGSRGFGSLSIAIAGVFPYISASLIIQILTPAIPALSKIKEEGGEGAQQKINLYTKLLVIPIAYIQGYTIITLVESQFNISVITDDLFTNFLTMTSVVAGTFLLVWIGELISEFGVANGISVVIFSSSVLTFPTILLSILDFESVQLENVIQIVSVLTGLAAFIYISVIFNEVERRVPVQYSTFAKGGNVGDMSRNYLPIKVVQGGVVPIIMATAFSGLVITLATLFRDAQTNFLVDSSNFILDNFNLNSINYSVVNFFLIILFTYAFQGIIFDTEKISERLKKNGGFIAGVRPGEQTQKFLQKIANSLNLIGALFLGMVFILPTILFSMTGEQGFQIGAITFLIVVSVGIEIFKYIKSTVDQYEEVRL